MAKTKIKYQPKIVRGRTEIWVPHNGKEIAFTSPPVINTYQEAGKLLLAYNQKVPTGEDIASLLHSAYCNNSLKDEPEFVDIRDRMKNNLLWIFNRILWAPNGVYVIHDKNADGIVDNWFYVNDLEKRDKEIDNLLYTSQVNAFKERIGSLVYLSDLEKMLEGGKEMSGVRFSKDGRLRFAPKPYTLDMQSAKSLADNRFIIASCGLEGAKKLSEVAIKFKGKPYVEGYNVTEGEIKVEQSVCAISDICGLHFDGCSCGDMGDGCAFGVLDSGEVRLP